VEVQKDENGTKIYFLAYDAGSQNISHLAIQVKYTNGNIFAEEIYLNIPVMSKDNFLTPFIFY